METNDSIYNLIDNYLDNKLSEEDNLAVEKKLKEDMDFREEVFNRKLTKELIIEQRYFEIAKSIRNVPVKASFFNSSWFKLIAATLTVLGVIAIMYFLKTDSQTTKHTIPVNDDLQSKGTKENNIIPDTAVNKVTDNSTDQKQNTIVTNKNKIQADSGSKKQKDESFIIAIPIDDTSGVDQSLSSGVNYTLRRGESWTAPVNANKKVELRILNSKGEEVFRTESSGKKDLIWNGSTLSGTSVSAGLYTYILDYGRGDIQQGNLVIKE